MNAALQPVLEEETDELIAGLRAELSTVAEEESRAASQLHEGLFSLGSIGSTKGSVTTDGKQMALQLESINRFLQSRVPGLNSQVLRFSEHLQNCQDLANQMSGSVRQLDEKSRRLQLALALVEDIINLKTCADGVARALEEGDLPDAISYVKQFHSIEEAVAKASDHYDVLIKFEAELKDTVMRRVQNAVNQSNLEDIFKYCPLLGPLGLAQEGARIYQSFAERLLKENLEPLARDIKTPVVQLLPRVYNLIAGFLQHHLPLVAHGFKQVGADADLIRLVHGECERASVPMLRRFIKSRALAEKCRLIADRSPQSEEQGAEVGRASRKQHDHISPELDGLMDELALVIQHSESYDRFVKHLAAQTRSTQAPRTEVFPLVTNLNGAIAEVSGPYTVLEHHLMRTSVKRALAIDESPHLLEEGGKGQTSSCVDDSFYVVRRSARRALVTGHAGTASAVVNYINSILTDEVLPSLLEAVRNIKEIPFPFGPSLAGPGVKQHWTKVKDQLEAGLENAQHLQAVSGAITGAFGTIGSGSSTEAEAAQVLRQLLMLNNLTASASYTLKLQRELMAEVPSIYQDDPSTQQLIACLQDLTQTSRQFQQAAEEGIQHIANLIKAKLRSTLSSIFGDRPEVPFELDEEKFAALDAAELLSHRLIEYIGAIVGPIRQRLLEQSYEVLLQALADYLCKRLETIVSKKNFTQLGGLQLDKELRCLMAFFASQGLSNARESFARILQMAQVLNADGVEDMLEAFGPGGRLSSEEVLAIIEMRIDITDADVGKARRRLLR